ncbi:MAG: UDP-N-acetylmuramate dehydrogenase [Patescibacteria group bacterium]
MDEKITKELRGLVGDRLKENEPLSKHLVFRVGGPAKWFVEVRAVGELTEVMKIAKDNEIDWVVLGGGSNAIASDQGYDGIVIKIGMQEIKIDGQKVIVDAGLPSVALARKASDVGLTGLEWMASLPGTVGGAIRGNAGCFGGEAHNHLTAVNVLRAGDVKRVEARDLIFGYRHSTFKDENCKDIILSAEFTLESSDPSVVKEKMALILDKRSTSQPLACGTAGCTFKNYEIKDEQEKSRLEDQTEIPKEMLESSKVSAGWLIDSLDLKGTRIGNAHISENHANFIINDGQATASDIVQLISLVKTKVRDVYNIQLEEEIEYIGF